MSGIGPMLPPHLQNLANNADSDSEDEQGPSFPPAPASSSTVGPAFPPHLQPSASNDEPDEGSDEEEESGPSLPPHLLAARRQQQPAVIVGPARPPQSYEETYSESDDDDVVGPSLPSASGTASDFSSGAKEFREREERWAKEREEAAKPKAIKREEWMLKPPEAGDVLSSLDLSKVPRAQTSFNRVSAAPIKSSDQSLWTETPAERLQRLQDEVSGKKRRAEDSVGAASSEDVESKRRRQKRDEDIRNTIDTHNSKHRAATLVDLHSTKEKEKKRSKDDAPPPIWDRDLHMSVTGRLMDEKSRQAKIDDAKGLSSRFGHSKTHGAYD